MSNQEEKRMRKALYLLGALNDSDVDWLITHGSKSYIQRGAILILEGRSVDSLFILLDGHLSVSSRATGGNALASLHAGEIVGEISFVDSRPPGSSVTAVRDSHVLEISRSAILRKMEKDVGFAARFYRAVAVFLADRLRMTSCHLGYGKPELDVEADDIGDELLDNTSLAATRFDNLLRRLHVAPALVAGN
jgi:CRP/FNR family cyclic AMP-dependent transcriptional regulator